MSKKSFISSIILVLLVSSCCMHAVRNPIAVGIKENCIEIESDKPLAYQITRKNTIYVIKNEFTLKGETIVIPEGCELVFDGGYFKGNGTLKGKDTRLSYKQPFLNGIELKGTFLTDGIPVDIEIFMDSHYDGRRIKSMFCVYGDSDRIVFTKNKYKDVGTIRLSRNADVDFSGSILKMKLDEAGLPVSFIYTEEKNVKENLSLDFFKLKNATIIGNETFEYDGTVWPKSLHHGVYRRCIQLFKVGEVDLENIHFENVEAGSSGDFHKDARERYELSIVSIMYYNHARINGCVLHDCFGDNLIRLVPNVTEDNMALVSNCTSYRNFTGLVSITDGRCEVFGNKCIDFNSSAMNLFVYESEIHDNYFENSTRSDCIDLSEDGTRVVHDVNIYNNKGVDINVFCSVCGDRINVYKNYSKTRGTSSLVWVDGTREPNSSLVNINKGLRPLRTVKIHDNEVEGGGIVSAGVYSGYNTSVRYIDTLFVENNTCFKRSDVERDYTHPVFLFNCRKAFIRDNNMKGLSKSPAGKGSASFICSFNILPEVGTFSNDVEITNNTFVYDRGKIGENVHKTIYTSWNSRDDNRFKVYVTSQGNVLSGSTKKLQDVYIPRKTGSRKIRSVNNKGIEASKEIK